MPLNQVCLIYLMTLYPLLTIENICFSDLFGGITSHQKHERTPDQSVDKGYSDFLRAI